jgi:hypothetical protein
MLGDGDLGRVAKFLLAPLGRRVLGRLTTHGAVEEGMDIQHGASPLNL